MAESLSRSSQRDILSKLEIIIEQNKSIMQENKILNEQNTQLIQINTSLKTHIESTTAEIQILKLRIDLILDNAEKIQNKTNSIEEKIIENDNMINFSKPSLKEVSSAPIKHSVLITPAANNNLSPTKWNEVAKNNITSKLIDVQVNKLGLTRKGEYFINFPNKQSQDKAIEYLKSDYSIKAQSKTIGILPKITICDIDSELYKETDKQKLMNNILSKNPNIKKLVDEGCCFEILFIQTQHQSSNRAILKVDPKILYHLNKLKEQHKTNAVIFIQNSACRFYNRFHIIQCYQCQSFGHRKGSTACPLNQTNQNTCLYCSLNHPSKDCPNKRQPDLYKCANCTRFSNSEQTCLNHTTTDHTCPLLQKQIENIIKNTRGLAECSKNDFAKHVFIT